MGEEYSWLGVIGCLLLGVGIVAVFVSGAGIGGVVMGAALLSLASDSLARRIGVPVLYKYISASVLLWVIGAIALNILTRQEFSLQLFPGEEVSRSVSQLTRLGLSLVVLAGFLSSIAIRVRGYSIVQLKTGIPLHMPIKYSYITAGIVASVILVLYIVLAESIFLYSLLVLAMPPLLEAAMWARI